MSEKTVWNFLWGCPWISIMYLSWEHSRTCNQTRSPAQTFNWHTSCYQSFLLSLKSNSSEEIKKCSCIALLTMAYSLYPGYSKEPVYRLSHAAQGPYIYGFCRWKPQNNLRRPDGRQTEMIVTFFVYVDHLDKYYLYYSWETPNRNHKHWSLCNCVRKRFNLIPATYQYGQVWM